MAEDLRHHGDAEIRAVPGALDFAVNVRVPEPPAWLRERLVQGVAGLAAYPDDRAATEAIAAHHGRRPDEVLPTAGAAEAFVLLARVLTPRRAVVVHPQFTEPEAALAAAGHAVDRVLLRPEHGFRLDPGLVPADADLVVVGNPTNPTSVLHPAAVLAEIAAEGRTLVVDEAFLDAVPGRPESMDRHPRAVVVRSLTKTWGLAGLRVGYVLGPAPLIRALREVQPLWSVSSLGLLAIQACLEPHALAEAEGLARRAAEDRAHLVERLSGLDGVAVPAESAGPFVAVHCVGASGLRAALAREGIVLRSGTFPGLGPDWLRVAVRDRTATDRLVEAWRRVMSGS